jgi:hypothetical protein
VNDEERRRRDEIFRKRDEEERQAAERMQAASERELSGIDADNLASRFSEHCLDARFKEIHEGWFVGAMGDEYVRQAAYFGLPAVQQKLTRYEDDEIRLSVKCDGWSVTVSVHAHSGKPPRQWAYNDAATFPVKGFDDGKDGEACHWLREASLKAAEALLEKTPHFKAYRGLLSDDI